ncbi:DUF4424 family protein [Massilia sp. YMA4]|uniref:DUF4424 family protein n=1 Tax=Massilia sp. YMA4 TaxID=1593482 RepID=UPI000DD1734F|nr:DUF4424 family protein [Massilia sp. YMA4]AXA93916.1 hypothetical protein DPH57_23890 [Massilia sp. YMA4]
MKIPVHLRVAAGAAVLLPALACANDGVAAVSAGGIVFQKTDAIAMKKEVLTVSHDLISVDYEFVNESGADVEETIAFPLPAYGAAESPYPDYYGQPANFSVTVNGKPVPFTPALRALRDGKDVTAELRAAGLSSERIGLNETLAGHPLPPFTAAQKRVLRERGLLAEGMDEPDEPQWKVQVSYVWRQRFPAGEIVRVQHRYRPFVAGGPAAWVLDQGFTQRYCADAAFLKGWRRAANGADHLAAEHVEYILKTGNTWKSGIEDFTLNIVKRKPEELVSLCFPGTFRKIDNLTYQVRLRNFRPADDLRVYFGNVDGGNGDPGVAPQLPR